MNQGLNRINFFGVRHIESTIREYLNGLTNEESIEYLIQCLIKERYSRVHRMTLLLGQYPDATPVGANLLLTLWDARGRVCLYENLSDRYIAWRDIHIDSRGIQSHMKRLRRMIEAHSIPVVIETVYGFGYKLELINPDWMPPWGLMKDNDAVYTKP